MLVPQFMANTYNIIRYYKTLIGVMWNPIMDKHIKVPRTKLYLAFERKSDSPL